MIEWREKMSIDDGGVIDQDHRHLIEIINRFEKLASDGLDKDEATEILYALKFYTQTHFGREEQLQNLIDFPYADAHHHEHEELVKTLEDVIEHLKESNEEVLAGLHGEISELLHQWLVGHILHSDLKMRIYVGHMKKHAENFGALKDIEVAAG
ncbi:hemerythrin family protein [Thalassospiraceae bacterium LMO-JJ14]|nr:hemerythrin family protein [Thalassospiraceae bacterium LMO-JJ14]